MVCSIETSITLDIKKADDILGLISNQWFWDTGRVSATSDVNNIDTVFFNDTIQFFNCWFEDLD
ncbi:hypothetical protein HOO54_03065 [Bacillus sp. WMMC1349]|nr:hypothetical protein [Bacillus sp. WMMC1349]